MDADDLPGSGGSGYGIHATELKWKCTARFDGAAGGNGTLSGL